MNERGLHKTFSSAVDAASADLLTQLNTHPFDREVASSWSKLFKGVPINPGKYDPATGYLTLYVANARTLYAMKSKQRQINTILKGIPGAPKNLKTVLQIRV